LEGPVTTQARWIKRETWTSVRVEGGICTKRYVVEPWLRWRTIGRRSRARREHDNLNALRRAGLPSLEALEWREERRFGLLLWSELATRWVGGARNLREWLRAPSGDPVRLARNLGETLAALHEAGFCWNTASPRNWLLRREEGGGFRLWVCDPVALVRWPGSVRGKRPGFVDLYNLALSPPRRREMSRAFRFRICLAYCGGDSPAARRIYRKLSAWPRFLFRLHKGSLLCLRPLLLSGPDGGRGA